MNQSSTNGQKDDRGDSVDLQGKLCPFAVMCVVREVDDMSEGDCRTFFVDDPLAIKSVPEELSEYEGVSCHITKQGKGWAITVSKK